MTNRPLANWYLIISTASVCYRYVNGIDAHQINSCWKITILLSKRSTARKKHNSRPVGSQPNGRLETASKNLKQQLPFSTQRIAGVCTISKHMWRTRWKVIGENFKKCRWPPSFMDKNLDAQKWSTTAIYSTFPDGRQTSIHGEKQSACQNVKMARFSRNELHYRLTPCKLAKKNQNLTESVTNSYTTEENVSDEWMPQSCMMNFGQILTMTIICPKLSTLRHSSLHKIRLEDIGGW